MTDQEAYCEAGDELRTAVDDLLSVDVVAEGTSGVSDAVDAVSEAATDLRDTGEEAAADDITALEDSIAAISDALSELGDDITVDNATAVVTAIGDTSTRRGRLRHPDRLRLTVRVLSLIHI